LVFQECMVMVAKAGLDVDRVMEVLKSSSAAVYTGLADMTLGRDFDNAFFTLRLANKDLSLALESARDLGVDLQVTSAAQRLYEKANEMGLGGKVFFATVKALEDEAGVEVPKPGERKT
jgi:3-hydroxyisobutyrate dehydrogenase-like beta-hydroxyacid dehydrogenase